MKRFNSTITFLLKMKHDINKIMKCSEIKLPVLADFSKALDTVKFDIPIYNLHKLRFSKTFSYSIFDYLSRRTHFLQIDSSCSTV